MKDYRFIHWQQPVILKLVHHELSSHPITLHLEGRKVRYTLWQVRKPTATHLWIFVSTSHLFGKAAMSFVFEEWLCVCAFVYDNLLSRHLYNSICLAKSGQTPAKMLTPCQNRVKQRRRKTETKAKTYACSVTEPKIISQQRSHLQSLHNSH